MTQKLSALKIGILSIILGSIVLGSVGIFVRLAEKNLQPMTQSFGRIFTAFVFITIFNLAQNKLKKETFNVSRKDFGLFIANGLIGMSLQTAAFTLSIIYTSISNTYFLLYTAPVFAAILSAIFLKEKIRRYIVIAILMSFVGLLFLFNPSNLTQNILGNSFGLFTGLTFGSYFVITGFLGKKYSSATITFWSQFFGALGILPLIFIFDKPTSVSLNLSHWLPVIGAGFAVFVGYYLLNYGLTKISGAAGSILSLFEPLSSVFYGLLLFSEHPSSSTLIGAFFILSSISYLTYSQTNQSQKASIN
ncbi:MAG: hypothetical protein UU65_C0002G0246 [candidate division CPR2 bacterium GW2011_GWC1_41_48]|uniref:EamA domain-containing protein n=1 Tax=candidate division CPR2 bacterium GW2011_GWC1_41_48 TaxID=1618344 RepID=A0A0G0Z8S6_UNCC2|nr:MAG: hypothetical protein UT47_C0002G0058 [candidate division CPR2 bacterium GW2011_GWC2_39_35]KKR28971.1 MAG: hypothetical protein UT60_C0008G0014 [candidate division CPR2 bacterium GW2011_GWD2_39_7]KKS09468.1 MAG: hypothetical protein UU65_C0002G0246 [candidate division CPR2 bacterium GW2011_GWC1_41_48]OGB70372.1 MAG: hypothetical protein A2Y26_00145 [candidate division CPR2 bacterium GWD2_39_7]